MTNERNEQEFVVVQHPQFGLRHDRSFPVHVHEVLGGTGERPSVFGQFTVDYDGLLGFVGRVDAIQLLGQIEGDASRVQTTVFVRRGASGVLDRKTIRSLEEADPQGSFGSRKPHRNLVPEAVLDDLSGFPGMGGILVSQHPMVQSHAEGQIRIAVQVPEELHVLAGGSQHFVIERDRVRLPAPKLFRLHVVAQNQDLIVQVSIQAHIHLHRFLFHEKRRHLGAIHGGPLGSLFVGTSDHCQQQTQNHDQDKARPTHE